MNRWEVDVRAPRAWIVYLAVGAVVVVVNTLMPVGLPRDLLYAVVSLSGVVAVLAGIAINRPGRPLPWRLLAAGATVWLVGDILWVWYIHVAQTDPFPSAADAFYLAAYPLLAGGLYQLARGRNTRGDIAALLDALIIAVVLGLVLWVVLIEPAWAASDASMAARVIEIAYPVGDVVLIVQLGHLRASPVVRSPALRLLTGAFLLALVADLLFQAVAISPYVAQHEPWIDPLWLGMSLLWGTAALHPSMSHITDGRSSPSDAFTVQRVLLLAAAFLVLPGLSIAALWLPVPVHPVEQAVVHVVLVVLVVIRMIDVVQRLGGQSSRLAHLADTDFLTRVDNRRRFTERLTDALTPDEHTGERSRYAVLLAGLDRFTEINDTLGHRVGDELLRTAAGALRGVVGDGVPLARIGGDVFGVLLGPLDDAADAERLAVRVRARLGQPMAVSGLGISVDGAVGLVVVPDDGLDAEDLLARADLALSSAREHHTGIVRYDHQMEDGGGLAALLMTELQAALEAGDVVVHFQPQVEVGTGRVIGAEALVRWQHPERGLIAPGVFVPAAERTGLIRLLTLVVLDRAVAQCAAWAAGGQRLTVAVNLSVRNLLDPRLVDDVCEILDRYEVPPSLLELEITETAAMVDPVRAAAVLGELARLGVTLSIDDYGTGYGSLAYLQRLPVRRLKIDRSFVAGVRDDPASAAIVRSTIELAHHLGLSVVAEGVEDDATLLALRDMHCFAAQGFGLGRPVPAAALDDLCDRIEARLPALVAAPLDQVPAPRFR